MHLVHETPCCLLLENSDWSDQETSYNLIRQALCADELTHKAAIHAHNQTSTGLGYRMIFAGSK